MVYEQKRYLLQTGLAQIGIEALLQNFVFSSQERNGRIGSFFQSGQNVAWAYPHDLSGFGVSVTVTAKLGVSNGEVQMGPKSIRERNDTALNRWNRLLITPHQDVGISDDAGMKIMTSRIEAHCFIDGAERLGGLSGSVQSDGKKSVAHAAIWVNTDGALSFNYSSIKPPLVRLIVAQERKRFATGIIQEKCFLP